MYNRISLYYESKVNVACLFVISYIMYLWNFLWLLYEFVYVNSKFMKFKINESEYTLLIKKYIFIVFKKSGLDLLY